MVVWLWAISDEFDRRTLVTEASEASGTLAVAATTGGGASGVVGVDLGRRDRLDQPILGDSERATAGIAPPRLGNRPSLAGTARETARAASLSVGGVSGAVGDVFWCRKCLNRSILGGFEQVTAGTALLKPRDRPSLIGIAPETSLAANPTIRSVNGAVGADSGRRNRLDRLILG